MEKTNHVGDITGSVVSNVNVINGSSQSNDKKLGTVKHIGKRNNLTLGWISITLSSLSLVISVITISMHHAISLDSAWPGFVLGVLAILTTVLIGFQIKSTIDIDSKFDEQRKNLENLIAAQAEKIIVPNFKITRLQSLSAKLTSVSYSWNKYERAGDGIYFFRSTFEACFRAAKDIMMDDYVSDNIKSNVPMICADTLTSLVVAKNNGIIDDDFLVSEDVMIKWLIETAPEVLRSSYYNHLRSNNGKDTL